MGSRAWVALATSLLLPLLLAAAPTPRPSPSPAVPVDPSTGDVDLNAPIGGLDDAPETLTHPAEGTHSLGGTYADATYGFQVPALGPEWTRVSPVAGTATVRGAFVHARGDKIRGLVAITVEAKPEPKDLAAFAKANFDTLTDPLLGFVVEKKFGVKVGGRDAFVVDFSSGTKLRKYEQLYFQLPKGAIAVLTFQCPAPIFDAEVADFRNASKSIQIR